MEFKVQYCAGLRRFWKRAPEKSLSKGASGHHPSHFWSATRNSPRTSTLHGLHQPPSGMGIFNIKTVRSLYGEINNQSDTETLQHDLGNFQHWDKTWLMEFAEKKCQILWITKKYKRNTIKRDYTIHGYSLQTEQEGEYLDVALQGWCQRYQLLDICKTVDMSWQYGTQLETRPANKNCKPVCKVRRWGLSIHQQHKAIKEQL